MTIKNPITSSTGAILIEGGESTVRYYADRGAIRFHRMPSGLRLYEREDCERIGRLRRQRREEREQRARATA